MATLATGLVTAIVLSSRANTIVNAVGTNLIIGTITTTTSSICNMIKYVTLSNHSGINEIVDIVVSIDLEFTVNIIEELVKEQQDKEVHESVRKALYGLSEILDLIHSELDSIKKAIELHNDKYFNSWRGFSWNGSIETIKKHNLILKHRYSILFELLKIYH